MAQIKDAARAAAAAGTAGPAITALIDAALRASKRARAQTTIGTEGISLTRAGVKLAMVSWANYPALGTRLPAALAPSIVQGELQDRVGFTGVTITDALGAGALGTTLLCLGASG